MQQILKSLDKLQQALYFAYTALGSSVPCRRMAPWGDFPQSGRARGEPGKTEGVVGGEISKREACIRQAVELRPQGTNQPGSALCAGAGQAQPQPAQTAAHDPREPRRYVFPLLPGTRKTLRSRRSDHRADDSGPRLRQIRR